MQPKPLMFFFGKGECTISKQENKASIAISFDAIVLPQREPWQEKLSAFQIDQYSDSRPTSTRA